MSKDNLETKLKTTERQLKELETISTRLQARLIIGDVMASYLHDEGHSLSDLAMNLSELFHMLKTNRANLRERNHLIRRITNVVDQWQAQHRLMCDVLWAGRDTASASLKECIEDSMNLVTDMFKRRQVSLSIRVDDRAGKSKVPKRLYRQVLINLLMNALEAQSKQVVLEASCDANNLVVSITDDGDGIPAKYAHDIWSPGFTTRENKPGLGLSITKMILESIGGTISVESTLKKSSKFTVLVPLNRSRQE